MAAQRALAATYTYQAPTAPLELRPGHALPRPRSGGLTRSEWQVDGGPL